MTKPEEGYRLLGFLPAGGSDATGFLRVPQVEGAAGYEVYLGRQYELPSGPEPERLRRVPAAELADAIRERIEDACTCDEALKEELLPCSTCTPRQSARCRARSTVAN